MDGKLLIWLFLFWTLGAPLVWILFDLLRARRMKRLLSDRPLPLRARMPSPARR